MKRLFLLFAFALVGALGFGVYSSFRAQDLTDVAGWNGDDRVDALLDVPKMIETTAKTRQPLTLSEKEVNTWLAQVLKVRQEGHFSEYVNLKGVWVRFEKEVGGRMEIIIERDIQGYSHTTSKFIRIERKKREDGNFTSFIMQEGGRIWGLFAVGGRFGMARVPQGFLLFTQSSFSRLGELFKGEIKMIEESIVRRGGGRILFEEGQMRIDFPKE